MKMMQKTRAMGQLEILLSVADQIDVDDLHYFLRKVMKEVEHAKIPFKMN